MEASWGIAEALLSYPELADLLGERHRIIVNDYVDATLSALFVLVVLAMVVYGVKAIRQALADPKISAVETGLPSTIPGASLA